MKKSIRTVIAGLLLVPILALGVSVAMPSDASYAQNGIQDGANAAKTTEQPTNLFEGDGVFKKITNTALFLIGAISVIMLIYGGIRYTTSGGNAASVTAAKNTILYAIVGIVVAVLAFAIVNFVLGELIA